MSKSYEQTLADTLSSGLSEIKDQATAKFSRLEAKISAIEAQMKNAPSDSARTNEWGMFHGAAGYESPGARVSKNVSDLDLAKRTGKMRFVLDGLHPAFEVKTLIDSSALGFQSPGIVGSQQISGIVPTARRRLTVRDMLRSKPIREGQVNWIQELSFTNAASPQSEGSDKAESENTFTMASEKVRTLAHWLPLTKQALDDVPELRRFIDENLIYGLKLIEEWEFLFGDGTSDHLHGLCHQASAYAGTYTSAGDSTIDKLRHIILEMAMVEEEVTGFVLNPKDWHDAELVKTAAGGTNTGSYIIGDPSGGVLSVPTVWNRPVVATTAMPVGHFLAGNFANAVIGDRQGATIDMSDSHDDYFIKNKIAVRAEERVSLAVLRTASLIYGSF